MRIQGELWGFSRSMLLQCLLLYIGIWSGLLLTKWFFLIVVAFTLLVACLGEFKNTYYHLFFLLPFSVIYKLSATATSLFVYTMILCAMILIARKFRFRKKQLILLFLLAVYLMAGGWGNYTTAIKILISLLLLYLFVVMIPPEEYKNQIMAYSIGLAGSTLIGTMRISWERLSEYYGENDYVFIGGERIFRFSGLNPDPNYYSFGVMLAMFLCVRLFMDRKETRLPVSIAAVILTIGGLFSFSKMFFLAALVLLITFIFYQIKSARHLLLIAAGIIAVLAAGYKWAEASGYLETMLMRFAGDITTGRLVLWKMYFDYLMESPVTLLFGDGLGKSPLRGAEPHNTFIDILYYLGLLGGTLYSGMVISIFSMGGRIKKRKFIDYALVVIFCFMCCSLSMLMSNEMSYYFMLLFMGLNMRKDVWQNEQPELQSAASGITDVFSDNDIELGKE